MSRLYLRPLTNSLFARPFVEGVLNVRRAAEIAEATSQIMQAEIHLAAMEERPTLKFKEYRSTQYSEDKDREALREQILLELIRETRLDNDDDIKPGSGGAMPQTPVQRGKQAFLIIGLPASGKSGIASRVADANGAVVIDSDYAKRKFPEFAQGAFAATVLHEESSIIVLNDEDEDEENLTGFCFSESYNIVVPKIGYNTTSVRKLALYFKKYEYEVHLILVSLDRQQATLRAYQRFITSKRYVPLSLIFDVYSNNPTLAYFRLKQQHADVFASFSEISTEERPARLVESSLDNPTKMLGLPT
ncbi:zeta toxin family protein [Hymenobacter ruricola]|uniref:Zeta toxin family protein n=1 Tax=Hymenobacter ruricola TaxID=2791023 RepID=A0ABS0HZA3_9BACT|nr:zeta toxin family protein [Hymenobacter ruricola]MBF9219979.1 zeta toxin family protein [Hymenobacter ruricola]